MMSSHSLHLSLYLSSNKMDQKFFSLEKIKIRTAQAKKRLRVRNFILWGRKREGWSEMDIFGH